MKTSILIKPIFALVFLFCVVFSAHAGGAGTAGAAAGLGAALQDIGRSMADDVRQREQIERQFELEKKRLEYRYRQEEAARLERERQERIAAEQKQREEIAKKEEQRRQGVTGSGFLVASGYVLTNAHVVDDYPHIFIKDRGGEYYEGTLVAKDKVNDLALIKVSIRRQGLSILPTSSVTKGEQVYAIGYPLPSIQGGESKITDGIVSSFSGLKNDDNWFQISAPVQGGNSGGPLVNKSGAVVGVVVAQVSARRLLQLGADIPQNVNYAIKPDIVSGFLKSNGVGFKNTPPKYKKPLDDVDANTFLIIAKDTASSSSSVQTPPAKTTISPSEVGRPEQRRVTANQAFSLGLTASQNQNYVDAAEYFKVSAEQGHSGGQSNLGVLYAKGLGGLAKDEAEAARWFRKAAEQGYAAGQYYLGSMYRVGGGGLAKDEVEAARWFRKAAEQGYAESQADLGIMYVKGLGGLAKDEAEAARWFRKAAEQGSAGGQANLGVMYRNGLGGLAKDEVEAVRWFRKAVEQGDARGQFNLGSMYRVGGGGLAQDEEEAVRLYRRAAMQGHPGAREKLSVPNQ